MHLNKTRFLPLIESQWSPFSHSFECFKTFFHEFVLSNQSIKSPKNMSKQGRGGRKSTGASQSQRASTKPPSRNYHRQVLYDDEDSIDPEFEEDPPQQIKVRGQTFEDAELKTLLWSLFEGDEGKYIFERFKKEHPHSDRKAPAVNNKRNALANSMLVGIVPFMAEYYERQIAIREETAVRMKQFVDFLGPVLYQKEEESPIFGIPTFLSSGSML
jgi:hypothetical protein